MIKRILHIGNHTTNNKNAGDTALFPITRDCFNKFYPEIKWSLFHVLDKFDRKEAIKANSDYDEILIGGGGMFLKDQAGSDISNSGWQWNSTIDALKIINIPINIFGVGYNRFRGQEDFDNIFTKHLNLLISKAKFIGLRNSGSIKSVQKYLNPNLKNKLDLQFCPTTCLWQINETLMQKSNNHRKSFSRNLAFNAAFDRVELRFPNTLETDIINVVKSLKHASKNRWKIIVVAHKHLDLQILDILENADLKFETKNLTDCSPHEVCEFYSTVDCSFGMRGHSQLIPLGLRKPIISIITHNKMRYLLEDINQVKWGIEIDDPSFLEKFKSLLNKLETNRSDVYEKIDIAQENIWSKTKDNFKKLSA